VSEPSWALFFAAVALCFFGLRLGLTTHPGSKGDDPRPYMLRRMARNTGIIIGIGSGIAAIHVLVELLG